MISLVIAAVLLLIHMLVCLVLSTLVKLGMLPVRGHMLPAMVLVPLWGPLLLVLCARGEAFGDALEDGTLKFAAACRCRYARAMPAWCRSRKH